ncbi:hypothetical protein G8759_22250 [Spirosoma aureum]|uniref:Uncharacterized protein n=1 Tax=Spirosoma aureum TaxID=2692134 RepID=A0A6G9B010_9BACT|nr:hypothetical protein G8759_22250 [Spirosoma aureum]
MDSVKAAQTDMRSAYLNGATGVLVSGLVWITTAVVISLFSTKHAIWALLVGGALIHPIGTLVNKLLGVKVPINKDNPLASLALEGTIFMRMSIPVAYGLALVRPAWFFQSMLMIIGGRYLTFHTLYGNKLYWLLGGVLGLSAYGLYTSNAQAMITTLTGGLIEIGFSIILYYDFSFRKQIGAARL